MTSVEHTAVSDASPDEVWALLADVTTWREWGRWRTTSVERPAPSGRPGDVGEVRVLRLPPITSREEVVESVPGRRLAYRLLSGLKAQDYLGEVDLTPRPGGGTSIRWRSTFSAGPLTSALVRRTIPDVCARVAAAAAARTPAA